MKSKVIFYKKQKKQKQHFIPTVKYLQYMVEGAMVVCGCLLPQGLDSLLLSTEQVYQDILQKNVRPSVHQQTLNRSWAMQQDCYPKHRNKKKWCRKSSWMLCRSDLRLVNVIVAKRAQTSYQIKVFTYFCAVNLYMVCLIKI